MKNWRLFSLFLLLTIFFTSALYSTPVMQVKVYIDSKDQFLELRKMNLDQYSIGDNYIEIITSPSELEEIQASGFRTEVVHSDLVSFYQSRIEPNKDMGGYMTLSEINAAIDDLVANHPDIVSAKYNIGQTLEGRDTWAIKISDNPNIDEDEPEILFTSAIHAREVITPMIVLNYANYMVDNYTTDPEIQNLVDNREIWIVPCLNPDGYFYNEVIQPQGGGMWRKNRRHNFDGTWGVDLNRNYGYEWGYDNIGSSPDPYEETYRGQSAFSEPETQNIRDFHLAHDFIISVYFHSHSNLIIWPYGYDYVLTPDEDLFQIMGDSCSTWNGYEPGPTASTIYTANGGSDDWIYAEQTLKNKTFAFTFEAGTSADGFWPPTSRIPQLLSENLYPMIYLTDVADHIYQLRPPGQPSIFVMDSIDEGQDFMVSWDLVDSINPPVAYELQQLTGQQEITDSANNFDNCENDGFSISSARSHTGLHSFFSGGDNNIYRYVQYDFPFRVEAGDSLKFYTWYNIENNWDYAYVQVSMDGTTYTSIPGNITTTYNPYGNNQGYGITGSSGGWVLGKFSLADYVGENISVRLAYSTDSYTLEEGIYFDDIFPISTFTNQQTFSLTASDTSYVFSQLPAGVYHYRVRAEDAENQWGRYSPVDGITVYALPTYTCGDANGDDAINVSDAVYIINYVFVDGPIPDPIESADANCDETVNVSDAVYIINFVFVDGFAPCDVDDDGIPDC